MQTETIIALMSFAGGLVGLLVAGHLVVEGGAGLGRRFGLSATVVGMTIVAAGTSAPELAVTVQSALVGDADLAIGSVVGSNIANILLVLGIAASLGSMAVSRRVVRIDVPVMIGASVAALLVSLDGRIGRLDGALMVLALALFVWRSLRAGGEADDDESGNVEPAGTVEGSGTFPVEPTSMARLVGGLVVGIVGLAFAARFVVAGAEGLAASLGVPELIIGLTVVALGTSAPEIVTTLIAALRGRRDLAVGNALGSNIFNILLVLGTSAVVAPGGLQVERAVVVNDLPIMIAAAVICLPLVWDRMLDRFEGLALVGCYGGYVTLLMFSAGGDRPGGPPLIIGLGLAVLTMLVVAVRRLPGRTNHERELPKPTFENV